MRQYRDLVQLIMDKGEDRIDRTMVGRRSIFGHQMRFDLREGFPLLSLKFTPFRLIASELLWFIAGETNVGALRAMNNHIWDEWADEAGELGPIYGKQWRSWEVDYRPDGTPVVVDQLAQVIEDIKRNPNSSRLLVSAWNVTDLKEMALPPCHVMFQFFVQGGKLSCQLYQRSADVFLGVPFNIASYALLTHMIASVTGLEAGEFIWTGGDCHLYSNHLEPAKIMMERPDQFDLPHLYVNPEVSSIDKFDMSDLVVEGYASHPHIAAPVAV